MRGWPIVVLFACVLSVGCGTSVPDPTEADVESYVRQRIGDQLFISMMALEGGREMQVFDFTVTQTLGVDLLRLRTASELKRAIGWEASKTSDARTRARKLPSNAQAELQKQWLEAEKTRRYVMELVHPQGMVWTSAGKVRARFDGENWTFDLREMKAPDNLSSSLVTPDEALQGLMVVDPDTLQPLLIWSNQAKPLEEG